MSTELLSPELEVESQEIEEDEEVIENMQQEIECPRCSDIITLSSDFDKLLYFCQECDLSLVKYSLSSYITYFVKPLVQ